MFPSLDVDWSCVANELGTDCACFAAFLAAIYDADLAFALFDQCTLTLLTEPSLCDMCGVTCTLAYGTRNPYAAAACGACLIGVGVKALWDCSRWV